MAQAALEPGKAFDMVLLPKFLGILPFDQAHQGALEAEKELGNSKPLQFLGPTPENSVAGQIEITTNATTQGVAAIMISNNSGDQIVPAAKAAQAKGIKVVTWDSPIPSAEGEDVFVAQVDFNDIGTVMADMALSILGEDGGKFAILSASPDAANQNAWIAAMNEALKDPKYAKLELLDTVYGNDQSEESYNQANALVDKYPDMELIMAPTSVGIVAAAKAMQDEGLCEKVKISGLGVPERDAGLHDERLRAGVRALELRRPRLPHLLHRLRARERRDQGRGRRELQGRPHGRLHDHQGPDPRRGPAHPDGTVHGLQQGQRRSGFEVGDRVCPDRPASQRRSISSASWVPIRFRQAVGGAVCRSTLIVAKRTSARARLIEFYVHYSDSHSSRGQKGNGQCRHPLQCARSWR